MTWRPSGLTLLERRATELDLIGGRDGTVLARIRVTPRRVVVELSTATAARALGEAHRLVAAVYDAIDASEGWLVAAPSVAETGAGARVVVLGIGAPVAVGAFFGVDLGARARRARPSQPALPLGVSS